MTASLKFNQKKNKLTDYFVIQSKTLDLKPTQPWPLSGNQEQKNLALSELRVFFGIVLSGGNIDIGLIPNLVRRNETNEGRRLTIFVRLPDRPGSLAGLVDVCAAQEANVIEVQHIREGVKLHPRETGIQVVLEVKSLDHSQVVIQALESNGFQLR